MKVVISKCEKVERRVLAVEEQEIFLGYLARTKKRIGKVGGLRWKNIEMCHCHF
ncbi:MAG: hypothetical protein ACLTEE_14695 [Anaerobutyricum hallii]